jgi:hypothetical protein
VEQAAGGQSAQHPAEPIAGLGIGHGTARRDLEKVESAIWRTAADQIRPRTASPFAKRCPLYFAPHFEAI